MASESLLSPSITVGLDLGDRSSHFCGVDPVGGVVEVGRVRTTTEGLRGVFAAGPPRRVVVEVGTHSPWVSRLLEACGHAVLVANPRKVRLIYASTTKTDRLDAEALARVGRLDPQLLAPIRHRGIAAQTDLAMIRSRDCLVRARTQLINHVRGTVKAHGGRLPSSSAPAFPRKVAAHIPEALRLALQPLFAMIDRLTREIRAADRQIEQVAAARYPETGRLRQVAGIGPTTSLCFVLTLEDPTRFATSRAVGAYLGLRPKQRDSGARSPQLRISKCGDVMRRRLLVGSAQYILGPLGPDCDLQRGGRMLAARGGKNAKKRAVVAVARKLACLLHRLWMSGATYEPFRADARAAA
jgi:transposase